MSTSEAAPRRIELGRLVRPVGIKGEVKLLPSEDFWPEALTSSRLKLALAGEERDVKVLGSRPSGDCLVLRLEALADRNAAEALRDAELQLVGEPDVALPNVPRSWQVEGMEVRLAGGEALGRATALTPMPGQPLLQVKGETKDYAIPFVPPILCGIDWAEGVIEIDPPDGLLEL